jgi:hypothetical protein
MALQTRVFLRYQADATMRNGVFCSVYAEKLKAGGVMEQSELGRESS